MTSQPVPQPDQGHVTAQHTPELGQLIDAETPNEAANGRNTWVTLHFESHPVVTVLVLRCAIAKPEKYLTVLVVDDIEASRSYLAHLVTEMGYHCLQVSSGTEALQCIDAQQADLVLLDLLMPDMEGFEITRQIRKRVTGKWLPVIVVSSLEGDEHFIHAMSVGAPCNSPAMTSATTCASFTALCASMGWRPMNYSYLYFVLHFRGLATILFS